MEEKTTQKNITPDNTPEPNVPPTTTPIPATPIPAANIPADEDSVATAEDIARYTHEAAEKRARKSKGHTMETEEPSLSKEYDEDMANSIDPYLEPDPTLPRVPYKESLFLSRGCNHCPESYVPVDEHEMRSCCKVGASNWMKGIRRPCENMFNVVEVRFKNNRKDFFRLPDGIDVNEGDVVAVEGVPGHDVGIVSLIGEACRIQMKKKKVNPDNENIKRLFRRAKTTDIEKWMEALREENNALLKTRRITDSLGLVMKVNDVEFQGDRSKATFYYTADDRVDFRSLIKMLADEFKVRVEMKQIGVRQEAGKVGGIGTCGRELCCTTWLTNFKSVTTGVAKAQQILPNPQKLAGQCGKLKCCLNFEYEVYVDALKQFPPSNTPIRFQKGLALYKKTDVLRGIMWYAYEGESELCAITAENVKKIIEMNRKQQYPEKLEDFQEELMSTAALAQETSVSEFEQELRRLADNDGKSDADNYEARQRHMEGHIDRPRDNNSRAERIRNNERRNEQIRNSNEGTDRQRSNNEDRSDRPRNSEGHSDRPRNNEGRSDRPRNNEGRSDRPRNNEGRSDRPRNNEGRSDRPRNNEGRSDRLRNNEDRSDRPRNNEGRSDRPRNNEGHSDRPRNNEGRSDRPRNNEGRSDRPRNNEGRSDRPRNNEGRSDRPRNNEDHSDNTHEEQNN